MDVLCKSLNKDENIPLADDDPQVIVQEKNETAPEKENKQNDLSASSTLPFTEENYDSLNSDVNADEMEEKARLIFQVLELQNTLDDLSQRVDTVKEENLKLRSENQVLGQYIENLMSASSVFQSTTAKSKK